jgi:inhibitor of KinA sporulation pathway (predicted exonuclease)
MKRYAPYVGEPSKRGGYRNQKLVGGDHSALGDALATLRLIEEMAQGEEGGEAVRARTHGPRDAAPRLL